MRRSIPIWVRSVAATLLFAMFYYFAGYRVVYFFIMHNAKNEAAFVMKHDKTALQNISFNAKEYAKLKWNEKEKEFSYHGQLYDVVGITKTGDKYTLQVYSDKNETSWVRALHDFEKQFFPDSNNDCDKGMKNAEGLASAFQKEYTPYGALTIERTEATMLAYTSHQSEILPLSFTTDIWHPPTC